MWTLVVDALGQICGRNLRCGLGDPADGLQHDSRQDITTNTGCDRQANDADQRPEAQAVEIRRIELILGVFDEQLGCDDATAAHECRSGPWLHGLQLLSERDAGDGDQSWLIEAHGDVQRQHEGDAEDEQQAAVPDREPEADAPSERGHFHP